MARVDGQHSISFDGGIHLRSTPLWFDAYRRRALCVLTRMPERMPPAHPRVVVPEQFADSLLGLTRFPSVLPVPLGRWIGVGGQKVQLLSTGSPWSAAALTVFGGERFLITSAPIQNNSEWPTVDHLVLPAIPSHFRGSSLERTVSALQIFIDNAAADRRDTRIVVDDIEAALVVSDELHALGIEHRRQGWLGRLVPVAGPARVAVTLAMPGSKRARVAKVETRSHRGRRPVDATFRLDWFGSVSRIAALARRCGAQSVTMWGETPISMQDWPSQIPLRLLGVERQLVFRDRAAAKSPGRVATN